MPRPCADVHPEPEPAVCHLCRLYERDPRYRALWAGSSGPTIRCAHLGGPTGDVIACPSCRGRVLLKVFACSRYGRCTPGKRVPDEASCVGCPDHVAAPDSSTAPVRNLLYYLYPVAGNGVWQRNVAQLLRRMHLFNGQRVVAIAHDGRTDPPGHVEDLFADTVQDFIVLRNDPGLREAAALPLLLERVRTDDPAQVTFYGHAKGVTRPVNPGVTCHPWADILYETCLDYRPLVEDVLTRHPIAGSFKKVGAGFAGSPSSWHYSGGFFWFRNRELFARDWRRLDRRWWGAEAAPGLWFRPEEAGVLFHEGRVPGLDLYHMGYLRGTVLPALERWRQRYERWRAPHAR